MLLWQLAGQNAAAWTHACRAMTVRLVHNTRLGTTPSLLALHQNLALVTPARQ